MQSRSFVILAAVTAVVTVAAIVEVTVNQRGLTMMSVDRERAFLDLADKVNEVAEIAIVSSQAKFSVTRTDKGWGLKEKSGYPVSFEKVKAAIVGLAELKLLETKTSDPERFARLQLEEPDKIDAKSIGVELKGAGGKTLAAAIIGKRYVGLFGTGGAGTYLRRQGEKGSWLAEGVVDLGDTPNDWMIRDIVNIEAEDVRRAVIRQPNGVEIVVHKADRKADKFAVEGVPEGRKLKDSGEGKNIAGGLWRLSFEDVKPASGVTFGDKLNTAEYETFDGLNVRIEMIFVEEVVWGRFTASAGDEADDKTKKKAAEINTRAKGWVYELSPGEGEKLTTKIADVLEDKKGS